MTNLKAANVEADAAGKLCLVHRLKPHVGTYRRTACEPQNCHIVQNDEETRAHLEALREIVDDLWRIELAALPDSDAQETALGTRLGSVLAMRAILAVTISELLFPMRTGPAEDEEERS